MSDTEQLTIDGRAERVRDNGGADGFQRSLFAPALQVPKVPKAAPVDPLGTSELFDNENGQRKEVKHVEDLRERPAMDNG